MLPFSVSVDFVETHIFPASLAFEDHGLGVFMTLRRENHLEFDLRQI